MRTDILFFANSILLGFALAMDAFSVSVTNGITEPDMRPAKRSLIAGVYGLFQFIMPMIGWVCVHTIIEYFDAFKRFTPMVALILLVYIGVRMIAGSIQNKDDECMREGEGIRLLIIQGVATSIDALSVGVTFAEYNLMTALMASVIIAVVTYLVCMIGLSIGIRVGVRFADKAQIIGGCILILIGFEIFIRGVI